MSHITEISIDISSDYSDYNESNGQIQLEKLNLFLRSHKHKFINIFKYFVGFIILLVLIAIIVLLIVNMCYKFY